MGNMVYPRTCGGTHHPATFAVPVHGLSPHLRGNRVLDDPLPFPPRSIPAPAGEPVSRMIGVISRRVYPRTCGGTTEIRQSRRPRAGLSPHLRGNRDHRTARDEGHRSIPAPAGEPRSENLDMNATGVYPRTCGGTIVGIAHLKLVPGLSPHLRGNHPHHGRSPWFRRSIPAPAGEPTIRPATKNGRKVYPRTCGGTQLLSQPWAIGDGLSPHLRGNQLRAAIMNDPIGSIPAPAGEPMPPHGYGADFGVYPRTCGGTCRSLVGSGNGRGLSPHLRGNRDEASEPAIGPGSIPAPAGEPTVACNSDEVHGVEGLSPHLRGNQGLPESNSPFERSIPAPAGEPTVDTNLCNVKPVYPRTCGGTDVDGKLVHGVEGLSPHLRGNRNAAASWSTT